MKTILNINNLLKFSTRRILHEAGEKAFWILATSFHKYFESFQARTTSSLLEQFRNEIGTRAKGGKSQGRCDSPPPEDGWTRHQTLEKARPGWSEIF
jgi:hypothetical protein